MAESSFSTFPVRATPLASFSYLSLSHTDAFHLRNAQTSRRQRLAFSKRLFVRSFFTICFLTLLTGSAWLLKYSYSTQIVNMERNYSHVYTANPLFVNKIVVTNKLQNKGPIIYGFSMAPKLDKQIDWTEIYDVSVQSQGHQEWGFWLNKGSQVDFRYNISDPSFMLLLLVVKGEESLHKWQTYQSSTDFAALLMTVQGAGALQYYVETDERYYFGFQNNQLEDVKVNVTVNLHSTVHSNDNFNSKCHLTSSTCAVHLDYPGSNVLLLTTPQISEGIQHAHAFLSVKPLQEDTLWSVNVTFEQRWFAYLIFWGAMAIVMLILLTLCRPSFADVDTVEDGSNSVQETTAPLLISQVECDKVHKAEQSEACSITLSDDDLEGTEGSGKFLCIICFDQQRNSFFDPCGHCATCYTCSMKIAKEKNAACPLCRQPIRFVRKVIIC